MILGLYWGYLGVYCDYIGLYIGVILGLDEPLFCAEWCSKFLSK